MTQNVERCHRTCCRVVKLHIRVRSVSLCHGVVMIQGARKEYHIFFTSTHQQLTPSLPYYTFFSFVTLSLLPYPPYSPYCSHSTLLSFHHSSSSSSFLLFLSAIHSRFSPSITLSSHLLTHGNVSGGRRPLVRH